MYLLNLRVQSYLPRKYDTPRNIHGILSLILGIEKIFWIYKYGQYAMFNLGKLWGIKNEGLLWVVKSLNTGLLICKYVLPIIGSLIGLALFMKYVPEINNVEILLRLLAIIIVFLYSIYKLFNYLKRI